MRKFAKIDLNQTDIVRHFRRLGFSVLHTHQLGHGAPDIFVAKNGHTIAVEIKDPNKPPSHRRLTLDEERWHKNWHGQKCIVQTDEDVHRLYLLCLQQIH